MGSSSAPGHSRSQLVPSQACLWLTIGLLVYSPLPEGGTTHVAMMVIRITVLLALGLFLITGIHTGRLPWPRVAVAPPVLAFLGLATLSALGSAYLDQSLQWLLVLATYALLLYLLVSLASSWDHVKKLLAVVVAMGVIEAAGALLQTLWFGAIRPSGTFFNPNFLGAYLGAIAVYLVGLLCYIRHPRLGSFLISSRGLASAALVGVLLCVGAAFLRTGSRGAMVAVIIGTSFVLALRFRRRAVLGLAVIFLCLIVVPSPLRGRVLAEHHANSLGYARWEIWQGAVKEMIEHPFGLGLGLYQYVYPRNAVPLEGQIVRYGRVAQTAHSEYVQIGVELGFIGVLVFVWGLWIVGWESATALKERLNRRHRGVLVGSLGGIATIVIHAAVDSNLHEPAIALIFALLVAVALSIRRWGMRGGTPEGTIVVGSLRSRVVWSSLAGVVIAICMGAVFVLGVSWVSYDSGNRAAARHEYDRALAAYRTALWLDPGKALYHSAAGASFYQIFERTKDRMAAGQAAAELERAIVLNPLDGRLPGLLGHLYLRVGAVIPRGRDMSQEEFAAERRASLQTALASYRRAVELDPHSPFHRYGLAQAHLALHDRASAEAELRRAVEEEPNFLPCRALLATVYNARGEKDRASDEFREIVERQQRFAHWAKDPLEQQYLNADAAALSVTLRGSGAGA